LFSTANSIIEVSGNCYVEFKNNSADESVGGAICSNDHTSLLFGKNANIIFNANRALFGGAVYFNYGNIRFD